MSSYYPPEFCFGIRAGWAFPGLQGSRAARGEDFEVQDPLLCLRLA